MGCKEQLVYFSNSFIIYIPRIEQPEHVAVKDLLCQEIRTPIPPYVRQRMEITGDSWDCLSKDQQQLREIGIGNS